eukprot:scaffold1883_cov261-Pinguiococcus_pyrenoidosus.AAC.16
MTYADSRDMSDSRMERTLTRSLRPGTTAKNCVSVAKWKSSGNTWMRMSIRYDCASTSRHLFTCSSIFGKITSLYSATPTPSRRDRRSMFCPTSILRSYQKRSQGERERERERG